MIEQIDEVVADHPEWNRYYQARFHRNDVQLLKVTLISSLNPKQRRVVVLLLGTVQQVGSQRLIRSTITQRIWISQLIFLLEQCSTFKMELFMKISHTMLINPF